MDEGIDVKDHKNKFNKCIMWLLSVEVKLNKEN